MIPRHPKVRLEKSRLIFTFAKNTEMNDKLRSAPGRVFDWTHGEWSLPVNEDTVRFLRENCVWFRDKGFTFDAAAQVAIRNIASAGRDPSRRERAAQRLAERMAVEDQEINRFTHPSEFPEFDGAKQEAIAAGPDHEYWDGEYDAWSAEVNDIDEEAYWGRRMQEQERMQENLAYEYKMMRDRVLQNRYRGRRAI